MEDKNCGEQSTTKPILQGTVWVGRKMQNWILDAGAGSDWHIPWPRREHLGWQLMMGSWVCPQRLSGSICGAQEALTFQHEGLLQARSTTLLSLQQAERSAQSEVNSLICQGLIGVGPCSPAFQGRKFYLQEKFHTKAFLPCNTYRLF